jgi:hypothetical protein
MDRITRLEAIEDIRVLKARYFRLMDLKRWDDWALLLTEDCTLAYSDDYILRGRAAAVATLSADFSNGVTIHQGLLPEITVESEDRASGIWVMADYNQYRSAPWGAGVFRGYGHYHETYRRDPTAGWQIDTLRLSFLRVDSDCDNLHGLVIGRDVG